jgi:hypothetical protein
MVVTAAIDFWRPMRVAERTCRSYSQPRCWAMRMASSRFGAPSCGWPRTGSCAASYAKSFLPEPGKTFSGSGSGSGRCY